MRCRDSIHAISRKKIVKKFPITFTINDKMMNFENYFEEKNAIKRQTYDKFQKFPWNSTELTQNLLWSQRSKFKPESKLTLTADEYFAGFENIKISSFFILIRFFFRIKWIWLLQYNFVISNACNLWRQHTRRDSCLFSIISRSMKSMILENLSLNSIK